MSWRGLFKPSSKALWMKSASVSTKVEVSQKDVVEGMGHLECKDQSSSIRCNSSEWVKSSMLEVRLKLAVKRKIDPIYSDVYTSINYLLILASIFQSTYFCSFLLDFCQCAILANWALCCLVWKDLTKILVNITQTLSNTIQTYQFHHMRSLLISSSSSVLQSGPSFPLFSCLSFPWLISPTTVYFYLTLIFPLTHISHDHWWACSFGTDVYLSIFAFILLSLHRGYPSHVMRLYNLSRNIHEPSRSLAHPARPRLPH